MGSAAVASPPQSGFKWDDEQQSSATSQSQNSGFKWDDEQKTAASSTQSVQPQQPRPIPTISAAPKPGLFTRARQSIANSEIGEAINAVAPNVASALHLEPTETEAEQQRTGDRNALPRLPDWVSHPLVDSAEQHQLEDIAATPPDQQQEAAANARLRRAVQPAQEYLATHPKVKAAADVVGGASEGINETVRGLTSPENLALIAVAPESKIITSIFAGQAAKGSFDNAEQAYQAWRAGKNPEAAKYLTESGLDAVIAGLAGRHAVQGQGGIGYNPRFGITDTGEFTQPQLTAGPKPPVEIPQERPALPAPGGFRWDDQPQLQAATASEAPPNPQNPPPPVNRTTAVERTTPPPQFAPRPEIPADRGVIVDPQGNAMVNRPGLPAPRETAGRKTPIIPKVAPPVQTAPVTPQLTSPAVMAPTSPVQAAPGAPAIPTAAQPNAPQGQEAAQRPIVQASTEPAEIQQSAEKQKPVIKDMAEAAVEGVPGAKVEGTRVKDEESVANKEDRGKPPETITDHLGARVSAPTPEAVEQVKQNVESQLPVRSADQIDSNGLKADQYALQTGLPGEANQQSELQVVTTDQAKAMKATDDLYEQQKKALAAGDHKKADELGAQIEEKMRDAQQPENQGRAKLSESPEQVQLGNPAPPQIAVGSDVRYTTNGGKERSAKVVRVDGDNAYIRDGYATVKKPLASLKPVETSAHPNEPTTMTDQARRAVVTSGRVGNYLTYAVHSPDGKIAGKLNLSLLDDGRIEAKGVSVHQEKKGYGTKLYEQAIKDAHAQGRTIISDQSGAVSTEARGLWDSLVRRGLAQKVGDGYEAAPAARAAAPSAASAAPASTEAAATTTAAPQAAAGTPPATGDKWIGVDLDGTLAHYDGFKGKTVIGEPIPAMVDRIKQSLADGNNVKILTARVSDDPNGEARKAIQDWTEEYLGKRLEVTDVKDQHMIALYDDRAVPVERNTGKLLAEPQPETGEQANAIESRNGGQPFAAAKTEDAGKEQPSAIREPETARVLQRQPEEAGGAGSGRERMEPGQQGNEVVRARADEEKPLAQPSRGEKPEEVKPKPTFYKAKQSAASAVKTEADTVAQGTAPRENLASAEEAAKPKTSALGSTTYAGGFLDPELFKTLFPEVARRMKEWATDEVTPGDEQREMMRETRGERDRQVAAIAKKLQAPRNAWTFRSREDSTKFFNAVESGDINSLTDPRDRELAKFFQGGFKPLIDEIKELKPQALQSLIQNYFPHIWEQPSMAAKTLRSVLAGRRPFAGSGSFLKQRTIPTMQDGLDMGLKPISWNPVDLFLRKYAEMSQFLMGHKTLDMMKEAGTAKLVRVGDKAPDGWRQLDDRIGTVYSYDDEDHLFIRGHYYAPADAAQVFNRYVSTGIAGHSAIYDTLRWINNNLNSLQLGISAFHASTTAINAATSEVALGIEQLSQGKPIQAAGHFVSGATVAPSVIRTMVNGSRMMREYLNPGSYKKFAAEASAVAGAGGRAKMDTVSLSAFRKTINAFRNGAIGEGLLSLPGTVLQSTIAPVMEWMVPRMKMGAFYDMAHNVFDQAERKGWDEETIRRNMQRAWDSVDNRFGQLVYENLFWHRAVQDTLMLASRSVGWNFGDLRELGGGIKDTAQQAAGVFQGKMPEVTPRMAFAMALPLVTGLVGAVLTYLWTGKKPETWKDYFYPKRQDGTRVSIPGYMKDVVSFGEHPVNTVTNKMSPLLEMTAEGINNRDFYGTEIRHKDDSYVKQLLQVARWAAGQTEPFAASGAQKLLAKEGEDTTFRWNHPIESAERIASAAARHPGDLALGQLGFQPAPSAIQNSAALNMARDYGQQNRPSGTRTQEAAERSQAMHTVEDMYRSGRVDRGVIQEMVRNGVISDHDRFKAQLAARENPIVAATKSLHVDQAVNVYLAATPDEQKALRPLIERKQGEINSFTNNPDERARLRDAYRNALHPQPKFTGPSQVPTA